MAYELALELVEEGVRCVMHVETSPSCKLKGKGQRMTHLHANPIEEPEYNHIHYEL
jgi:hypothetical protein